MRHEAEEAGFGETPWEGIFLMRGQSLTLSSFTLTESDDGSLEGDGPTISMSTHMAPHWLNAAVDHARSAERLSHKTNSAFKSSDPEAKCSALNAELVASMQAVTCAAFAVDALYASLLEAQPTPDPTKNAWRKNKTKRSRQIFETLRRAFSIGPKSSKRIGTFLDQLTNARDRAVHPPSRAKPAVRHSRLPVGIDPAFDLFRARNAIVSVGLAIDLVEGAARAETAKSKVVSERMSPLLELVTPVVVKWRRTTAGKAFQDLQRSFEEP